MANGGQLERGAQFILVEGDIPGGGEIAVGIGGDGPGLVGGAGVVVAGVGDVEDLVGDDFAGGEAAAGDVHSAPRRVIGLIGGDPGGGLSKQRQSRKQKAESRKQKMTAPES